MGAIAACNPEVKRTTFPVVLTIAGSDSGGGAGIQADLATFTALGVHGTSAIACVTAQNPRAVTGIQACTAEMVRRQIEAVFAELHPAATKTGMLFSRRIVDTVADFFERHRPSVLVVDPVMVSTSGARLLKPDAIRALCHRLLPLATLVTPNLDEAKILAERPLVSVEDLRFAARFIHQRYGCGVLVKGGHLRDSAQAIDIFFDGTQELLLSAPFAKKVSTHGTGCTYSAAITAGCALGFPLEKAVALAKNFITQAIHQSIQVGNHSVLNWAAGKSSLKTR
jgi:hydroxymethylpyrimidine/phosphomethylpyrimidine kinase